MLRGNSSIFAEIEMITKILTYKNGHFYDKTTGERLEIRDGIDFSITCALDNDFYAAPPAGNYKVEALSSAELLEQIKSDTEISSYSKRYNKNDKLYFSIKRLYKGGIVSHEFEAELLEDLYFFHKKHWKKDDFRLYDCACKLVANTSKTIEFFEPVYAKSLNELYKSTFVHYFGNKGNPACNALDRFYDKQGEPEKTIGRIRTLVKRAIELKEKLKNL